MNRYPGEERRQTTPIEVRKVSNGARYAMISITVAIIMMALAGAIQLVIIARWTGRMETIIERQVEDTTEIRKNVGRHESRLNRIEILDATMLQMLQDHRRVSE